MKFYFCEKCGKRLTDQAIKDGDAKHKKLNGVFCADCAIGIMTMESMPLSNEKALEVLRASSPPTKRRTSSIRRANAVEASRPARRSSYTPPDPAKRGSQLTYFIAMGVAGTLLTVLGGFLLFGGKDRSARSASDLTASKTGEPNEIEKADASPINPAVPRAAKEPASHAQHASQAPSPKDLFEQRHKKDGEITPAGQTTPDNPPEPVAVVPSPTAGVSTNGWINLLSDQSLSWWTQPKGVWTIKSGVATGDSNQSEVNAVALSSKDVVRNYELQADIRLQGFHFAECWLSGQNVSAPITIRDDAWHTFRAINKGRKYEAYLDGKQLELKINQPRRADGHILFYTDNKGVLQLRKMRLRLLTDKSEQPWTPLLTDEQTWGEQRGKPSLAGNTLNLESAQKMGRLATKASFKDFDLKARIKVLNTRFAEVHVRGLSGMYPIGQTQNKWVTLLIGARGGTVKVRVDGKEVRKDSDQPLAADGTIAFYVKAPGTLKVKDAHIRIRNADDPLED